MPTAAQVRGAVRTGEEEESGLDLWLCTRNYYNTPRNILNKNSGSWEVEKSVVR